MEGPGRKPPRLGAPERAAGRARGGRRASAGIAAAAVAAGVALFLFVPGARALIPPCLFHRFTGLDCPLCGGLRAADALLRGEVGEAFLWNPLLVVAGPVLAVLVVRPPGAWHPWTARMLAGGVLAFWIVRNLARG